MYAEKLKELREDNNLNQSEIAKILKIDNSVYAKYEKEYEIIPLKHLNTLCNYFNVSLDYIFSFSIKLNYIKEAKNIDYVTAGNRLKAWRKEKNLHKQN